MKSQDAKRTQTVVRDDPELRVELPSRVTLMKVGEGNELGGEN